MKVRIPKNNNNKGKSINGIEKLIDIYTNQILEELERKGSTIIRKIDVFSYMLQNKYLKIIVNNFNEITTKKSKDYLINRNSNEKQAQDYMLDCIRNEIDILVEKEIQNCNADETIEKLRNIKCQNYIKDVWDIMIPDKTKENSAEIERIEKLLNKTLVKCIETKLNNITKKQLGKSELLKENIKPKVLEKLKLQKQNDFFEEVRKYTNDFSFLACNRDVYFSNNGYSNNNNNKDKYSNVTGQNTENYKFSNADNYFKFNYIQSKIKNQIELGYDEEKAIIKLLKTEKLSDVENKILKLRRDKILKKHNFNNGDIENNER